MSTTTTLTRASQLAENTVAELKQMLQDLGIAPGDVEPIESASTTPIKADLIRAIQEAEAKAADDDLSVFRYATFENPKTGNQVTKSVTTDGKLSKRNQEATGLTHVEHWVQVRALNRPDALARIEAGEGTRFIREDGEVRQVR